MTATDSALRLALSIPFLIVCVGAVIWASGKLSKLRSRREEIQRRLRETDRKFYELISDPRAFGRVQRSLDEASEGEGRQRTT